MSNTKRVVTSIEIPPASFVKEGREFIRVMFIFLHHPTEVFDVECSQWIKILDASKAQAPTLSWNELRNSIYYAVAMQNHDELPLTIS